MIFLTMYMITIGAERVENKCWGFEVLIKVKNQRVKSKTLLFHSLMFLSVCHLISLFSSV